MGTENLISEAIRSIVDGDEDAATKIADTVIAEGINPIDVINDGFSQGMIKVGDLFAREEYSLPEVLLSADAMQKAIDLLAPHIPKEEVEKKLGTVVIGTVLGDIHDIGKRIVATMLEVYGFEVHDLGRDVPIDRFVEKTKEVDQLARDGWKIVVHQLNALLYFRKVVDDGGKLVCLGAHEKIPHKSAHGGKKPFRLGDRVLISVFRGLVRKGAANRVDV